MNTTRISNPLNSVNAALAAAGQVQHEADSKTGSWLNGSAQGEVKKVLVINTGGTASMQDRGDGVLDTVPGYLTKRIESLDELKEPSMPKVVIKEYDPLMDSSSMEPSFWLTLAKDISDNYYDYDGFVVVMGTDTMAYAASALSFLMENLAKTIVLTGSQIPLCQPYTDCRRNILVSIIMAANGDYPEVCLFFNDRLMRACRCTKVNSFGLDAFDCPNFPPLATLATGIAHNKSLALTQPRARFRAHDHLVTNIVVLKLIPGFDDTCLGTMIKGDAKLRAIVLEVYGSGTAPAEKAGLRSLVKEAGELGILVVAKTQCLKGAVLPSMYASSSYMAQMGIVPAGDMTTEALVTKLSYLFSKLGGREERSARTAKMVGEMLTVPLRGEVSSPEIYTRKLLAAGCAPQGLIPSRL